MTSAQAGPAALGRPRGHGGDQRKIKPPIFSPGFQFWGCGDMQQQQEP